MRHNALDLIGSVTEFLEGGLDRLVNDFQHAAAGQQLVFDEGNVRFDSRRVAIHQKANRSRGREYSYLRVAITMTFSSFRRVVPSLCCFLFQMRELFCIGDLMHRASML